MTLTARHFPAVVLTGPCRAGKTRLLHRLFSEATDLLSETRRGGATPIDPQRFLDSVATPAILDEVQNVPGRLAGHDRSDAAAGRGAETQTRSRHADDLVPGPSGAESRSRDHRRRAGCARPAVAAFSHRSLTARRNASGDRSANAAPIPSSPPGPMLVTT
jgi:hypothetical protein